MKKIAAYILISLFIISLSACFKSTKPNDGRVKCPNCGYEFIPEDH